MNAVLVLLIASVALLTACAFSLWTGKTVGLYGMIETRASVFYWLIVLTYGGLGVLSLTFAVRMLLR